MGGDLGALLGPDAHEPFLGEVLGHADEVGASEEGDAGEHGDGGGEDVAQLGGGAAYDDEDGEPEADEGDSGEGPGQLEDAAAAADLHPAGAAGVVRLAPDEDGAGCR